MEFKIKVNPEKEKEFLQIMRSLQSLQVVQEMEEVTSDREKVLTNDDQDALEERTSREFANQYRDLVD